MALQKIEQIFNENIKLHTNTSIIKCNQTVKKTKKMVEQCGCSDIEKDSN